VARRPTRRPIEDGYFTIPERPGEAPRLLGSRCRACGEHFFPRRVVCARCLAEGCVDVLLGPRGNVYTWTYVHVPLFAKRDRSARGDADGRARGPSGPAPKAPRAGNMSSYGVAQVDLPEGPRVQGILLGESDDFHIGMEVELDLETLGEDGDGNEVVIFRFHPVGPAGDAAARGRA
jgi:uncharacterized OB-fold protein